MYQFIMNEIIVGMGKGRWLRSIISEAKYIFLAAKV